MGKGKMILRILQVTFGAAGGLLVVPVAVNLGTGGTPPPWLAPYVDWLWPVALGCVALVILIELCDKLLLDGRKPITRRRPNDPRNYQLALAQAARHVELRQRGSLAQRVRLALALDERPAAVHQPVHLVQRVSGEAFQLSADLGIVDVFDQMNESMLILGAPGAGKTTQLLDLACALIAREQAAEPGTEPCIPVVVDLAGWSGSRRLALFSSTDNGPCDFTEWLLASLRDRYRIPEAVARTWLGDDRFTLLLDGLDEVSATDRERCVREINALQTHWGITRLAVCSRTADYDELYTRLSLQGAVMIRPLTKEQVVTFFTDVSPRLGGVLDALRDDPELWELLTSPLMLNIVALAYGDRAAQALTAGGDQAQRRARLFDAYVVEVLARRRSNESDCAERTLRAVRALARASTQLYAGVAIVPLNFYTAQKVVDPGVSDIAASWLFPAWGAACGVVVATAMGATWPGLVAGFLIWLLSLLLFARGTPAKAKAPRLLPLAIWVLAMTMSITVVVLILRWLSLLLVNQPRLLVAGVGIAVTIALVKVADFAEIGLEWLIAACCLIAAYEAPRLGAPHDVLVGWAAGVAGAISWLSIFVVIAHTGSIHDEMAVRLRLTPTHRVSQALLYTSSIHDDTTVRPTSTHRMSQALLYTGTVVVMPIVLAGGWSASSWSSLAGWLAGVCYGFIPGVVLGYLLTGPILGSMFTIAGESFPWRRALLRFTADRSLLTVVDGEYCFTHLLVRDYLAGCDPHRLADQVNRRRAELVAPHTVSAPSQQST